MSGPFPKLPQPARPKRLRRWDGKHNWNNRRTPPSPLYRTKAWKATRNFMLRREGLCRQCRSEGLITAGEEVDHIVPHREFCAAGGSFYDRNNLQVLCRACHFRKSAVGK